MKLIKPATFIALAISCSGCLVAPFQPPEGAVTSYKAPLSTEGKWQDGTKVGKASTVSVLGIVSVGDCSLHTAMDNGGLTKGYYADYEYLNVFGIYQKVTVSVVGE